MYESVDKSKRSKIWIIILISIIILTGTVIYFQNKSIQEDEKGISELKETLHELSSEIKSLKIEKRIVQFKKDSLQKNLDYLWVYKPLVQATKFRDQVNKNFNFNPGDRVRLKSDSSIVVITDLLVGGNKFNYFIKFLVKNNKGNLIEVSPIEIEKK